MLHHLQHCSLSGTDRKLTAAARALLSACLLAALLSAAYAQGLNYGTGSGPGLCPVGTTIESGPEVFFNCAGEYDQAADGSGQVVWLGGAAAVSRQLTASCTQQAA